MGAAHMVNIIASCTENVHTYVFFVNCKEIADIVTCKGVDCFRALLFVGLLAMVLTTLLQEKSGCKSHM